MMRNRQQLLDEIPLDLAATALMAESGPSVATVTEIARGDDYRRSAMDMNVFEALGGYGATNLRGWPCAIVPDDVQSKVDRAHRLKSNFLAAANHELRQPAQALALLLPSIERQVATNPQAIKTIDMMRQAVEGLNGLLGAMLEISYLDADLIKPSMRTIDVGALLRRLSIEYAEKASLLGLQFKVFAPQAFAFSDPHMLKTTLHYLIENALRFTSRGGALIGLRRRGKRIRIDVVDTGMGVPRERQSEIFEEFVRFENPQRQSEKGPGLGLAIASRQAALLGANIDFRSYPGKGSRFSLWLPATPADERFGHMDTVDHEGRPRVLIVEDDAILRFSLESLMEQWGYDALAAGDAQEALKRLADQQMSFDAIVTDYHMGSGMTGVQMVEEIERRADRRFPALILTGETRDESLAEIAASGIEVAHKPMSPDELQIRLFNLLSSARAKQLSPNAVS